MKMSITVIFLLATFSMAVYAEPALLKKEWTVDGVTRKVLLHIPKNIDKANVPVIFAFHGHGGNMLRSTKIYQFHVLWSKALVVYMQGLPAPGKLDPKGQRSGWQKRTGDQQDRDLKFFDVVLSTLKKDYSIDEKRIYAMGHSNGGAFTYLLWAERGEVFAAVASSACGARPSQKRKPLPVMHIAGKNDEIMPFEKQMRTMKAIRRLNHCKEAGHRWAATDSLVATLYLSKNKTPFIAAIHPDAHEFPDEAPSIIIKFFKDTPKNREKAEQKWQRQ
ncbi:MAG: prolyl oligopeptidase family serine peptidase [Desulfobacteraceae bacterium]|nr:prolyl oligopeptidase family serine peptidase [Desulfobacteraceae bacterium]